MRSTKSNYSFRRRHVHIEFFRTFVVTKPYQSMNHDKAYHIIRITLADFHSCTYVPGPLLSMQQ